MLLEDLKAYYQQPREAFLVDVYPYYEYSQGAKLTLDALKIFKRAHKLLRFLKMQTYLETLTLFQSLYASVSVHAGCLFFDRNRSQVFCEIFSRMFQAKLIRNTSKKHLYFYWYQGMMKDRTFHVRSYTAFHIKEDGIHIDPVKSDTFDFLVLDYPH